MEDTEASLELLVKNLRCSIEEKMNKISPAEVSLVSDEIPDYHSVLEFRDLRNKFLSRFDDPCPIPQATCYSEKLMKSTAEKCDLPADPNESMRPFFESELARIGRIRKVAQTRCFLPENFSRMQLPFAEFNDALTRHAMYCAEGITKVESGDPEALSEHDLLRELNTTFCRKRRNALLSAIIRRIRRFPLTDRQSICATMFEETQKILRGDQKARTVPVMLKLEKDLNEDLTRLAHRFAITPDFNSRDGQQFLYHSDTTFETVFKELSFFELPKRSFELPEWRKELGLPELTQNTLLKQTQRDVELATMFKELVSLNSEQVSTKIAEAVKVYNSWVGNEAKTRSFANKEKERAPLPSYKLSSWMKLRFISMKFLACAVLTNINYFEYLKSKLIVKQATVMRSNSLRCGYSKKFQEILEVYDESGPFLFESAVQSFHNIMEEMITVGSYYTMRYDAEDAERSPEDSVMIDRGALIEMLLRTELEFLNAKRQFVQPLIEILEHGDNGYVMQYVHELITERPRYNMPVYKSCETPYKIAIRLMERKGQIVRSLVNMQIMHERDIALLVMDTVPIFDRPSVVPCDGVTYRTFNESVPISPLEVYESLWKIADILHLVPRVSEEIAESMDIRLIKYGNFMELAVWEAVGQTMTRVFDQGIFPFDRASLNFHSQVSASIIGLFTSPFVNTVEAIEDLIARMLENRRARFMNSMRRFMYMTWKLQSAVIDTNLLQTAYRKQCEQLGITERNVLMMPFRECAMKEIIDLYSPDCPEDLLDLALAEFEVVTLDFFSESSIKDVILAADFVSLKRMLQFQKLQNMILEIGIRFNRFILDSNFLCSYFDLGADVDMFVTGVDVPDEQSTRDSFFKQYVAMKIFYQSTTIYRDNQLAQQDKNQLFLSIRDIKSKSRTILSAHVKQKKMSDQEMMELYISEMLDAFSPYAYRIEIATICTMEKHILLCNSFVDTFALGPDPTTCLLNNNGRFEKFFYVPTWVEVFLMIRGAPHARQAMVLQSALQFLHSRFRILALTRHESSLSQRLDYVFEAIYNENYRMETPVFQELFHEFNSLANSDELEIGTKYIIEKEKFLFERFEFVILSEYEAFFKSLTSGEQRAVSDLTFGDKLKTFWRTMHEPLKHDNGLILFDHYVPLWQEQFMFKVLECDRADLVNRLSMTDSFLHEALKGFKKSQSKPENSVAVLPNAIDFVSLSICLTHIKFAYFLLQAHKPVSSIDIYSSISDMTVDIYAKGSPVWDSVIVEQANVHLVPQDEAPSKVDVVVSEPRLVQATFDVVRHQIDMMLLACQLTEMQEIIDRFKESMEKVSNDSKSVLTPPFTHKDSTDVLGMTAVAHEHVSKEPLVLPPDELDVQFNTELRYFHAKFLERLEQWLQYCVVAKNDDNSLVIDGDAVASQFSKLSYTLEMYTRESLDSVISTWKKYLATLRILIDRDGEEDGVVEMMHKFTESRLDRKMKSEIALLFYQKFIELNALRDRLRILGEIRDASDQAIEQHLRMYYEKILSDIRSCIEATKKDGTFIRQRVCDYITQKVTRAHGVSSKLETSSQIPDVSEFGISLDDEFLDGVRGKSDKLRKEIIIRRVLSCMAQRSLVAQYTKKLVKTEEERKKANIGLWAEKFKYFSEEEYMEQLLHEANVKLVQTKSDIEQVTAMLDDARMNNCQLVHWKAYNMKTVDELKHQLSLLDGVGDINVGRLLRRLEAGITELEELREVGDRLEYETEETVRRPLRTAEGIRRNIKQIKMTRTLSRQLATAESMRSARANEQAYYQGLLDENAQLKNDNEQLWAKIQEMEQFKQKKSVYVQGLMEDALHQKALPMRARTRMGRRVFKPTFSGRPVSRV